MMKARSIDCVVPRNGPMRMLRKRAEMHEPSGVPANGGLVSVPTRPSGSKSMRIEPLPKGPADCTHEPRLAPARSTAAWAFARLNGASAVLVDVVAVGTVTVGRGGGMGGGLGVAVKRVDGGVTVEAALG